MFSKHKNILIILVLLVVSFFSYWYFVLSKKDATQTRNVSTGGLVKATDQSVSATTSEQLKLDRQFVNGILTLNSVKIDVGLFKTPAFQALNYPDKPFEVDYAIPVGRGNPFLPIGVNGKADLSTGTQVTASPATSTNTVTPALPPAVGTSTGTTTVSKPQVPQPPKKVNR